MAEESREGLEAVRLEKLRRIEALGHRPLGARFDDHQAIADVRALCRCPEAGEAETPGPARPRRRADHAPPRAGEGRSSSSSATGPSAIQVFVGKKQVGEAGWALAGELDLGDLIGVDGTLGYTKTGELTIFADELTFLGKCLLPPPEKWHGLTDLEQRYRQRYLDLFSNPESLADVPGPVEDRRGVPPHPGRPRASSRSRRRRCTPIAGGAAARPFVTHHNTLDIDLFLRIALELHLKRLLVGGMERVYEIGRVFRNEGISPQHNPEFTMLEAVPGLRRLPLDDGPDRGPDRAAAIDALDGGCQRPWGETTIDFTPPWPRRTYADLFREHVGVDPTTTRPPCAQGRGARASTTAGKDPDVIDQRALRGAGRGPPRSARSSSSTTRRRSAR